MPYETQSTELFGTNICNMVSQRQATIKMKINFTNSIQFRTIQVISIFLLLPN